MDVRRIGRLSPALAGLALTLVLTSIAPSALAASVSERQARRAADRDPKVMAIERDRRPLTTRAHESPEYGRWEITYYERGEEVALVYVDLQTGAVAESWTGYQVDHLMARGYESWFGRKLNAPYVWIPLAALFFAGLLDWRRPWRIAHLDLLVLLSFGISHVFFNRGDIGLSVPLAYPPLVYLLGRMLWIGLRGGGLGRLRPSAPIALLAVAAVGLLGFRIALNVVDSSVIDVGYAGVIGADRISDGEAIYGEGAFPDDTSEGDTYGPANYYTYVPFELVLPWTGDQRHTPAGHAAAIFFDLATVAGLFLLGGRLRPSGPLLRPGRDGRALGTILAFAWLAYPYTDFALQSNSNDTLIAALLVWSLVLFASPWARGTLLGLAAMTKFAPLALAPLFAGGARGFAGRTARGFGRPELAFGFAVVAAIVLMLAHPAIDPGLAIFWERTISNQLQRSSPFSVWGQAAGLQWLQTTVAIAAIVLAILLAFVPARRSLAQIAALAASVIIGLQLAGEYWFYLYIPWFFGLALVALAAGGREAH